MDLKEMLNIAGIIFFIATWIIGILLKCYTRRRLKDIDGLGECHTKDTSKNTTIWL